MAIKGFLQYFRCWIWILCKIPYSYILCTDTSIALTDAYRVLREPYFLKIFFSFHLITCTETSIALTECYHALIQTYIMLRECHHAHTHRASLVCFQLLHYNELQLQFVSERVFKILKISHLYAHRSQLYFGRMLPYSPKYATPWQKNNTHSHNIVALCQNGTWRSHKPTSTSCWQT